MDHNSNWQQAAIEDLEHSDLSYKEIGEKYGRSRDTIIKLKRNHSIMRKTPTQRLGLKKMSEEKSLSPSHRALGSRLTVFRANKTYRQVADMIGVSGYVLKKMELGAHDFTLVQLLRISELLGMSVESMITPITLTVRRGLNETV